MQTLLAKNGNPSAFEDLGRASLRIVHDLKNQLNGLKLYATFLKRRLDRDERPNDERETIAKLMAGIDRAANDLTAIVRYARPQEVNRQPHVDLVRIVCQAVNESAAEIQPAQTVSAPIEVLEAAPLYGEFDSEALVSAIKMLIQQVTAVNRNSASLSFSIVKISKSSEALVEWRNPDSAGKEDLFRAPEGVAAVRMALATRIIEEHSGRVEHDENGLRVWLPLT